jgi:hypothetical protein
MRFPAVPEDVEVDMTRSYNPTEADLRRGIEHVCYEYANLISAAHWSINGQAPWRTNVDDAFLLGYRKLRDFLLQDHRSQRENTELPDILAGDYLTRVVERTWALPTWDRKWRAVMNRQLAHLSFEREEPWDHRVCIGPLESEIRAAWSEFLQNVDAHFRPEFETQLERCRRKPGFSGLQL